MAKYFIPGNVPSSKNGRRWTGKYFISSKTVMKYRKDTKPFYQKTFLSKICISVSEGTKEA
jgi:hypothetical protein